MDKSSVLRRLDFGGIVAEHDNLLTQCFIKSPELDELTQDKKDLILGAKGAGKSALWKEIKDNQSNYPELYNVNFRLIANPNGDPEFREVLKAISSEEFPDYDELRTAWKLYFLSQFWKATSDSLPPSRDKQNLENDFKKYGIIQSESNRLKVAFAYSLAKARALRQIDVKWTEGLSLSFSDEDLKAGGSAAAIPFNDLAQQLNDLSTASDQRFWLILDRLDEIILGDEERENIVLKGLLLAYRDFSDYPSLRLKIFLRDDVYQRVTSLGHFPALTHVRSRAAGPIRWQHEDLLHLLTKRLAENKILNEYLSTNKPPLPTPLSRREYFYRIFPEKVDKGRAADGFKWVFDRIIDGNGVATPRDLLSVFDAAKSIQIDQFTRDNIELPLEILFSEDTMRKAVRKVATDNLETRIYAEYPDLLLHIKAFTNDKADHNEETLARILGNDYASILPRLERVGFIYKRSRNGINMWTIPFFYSFALDIKRGAAFDLNASNEEYVED